ncbi:MAG: carboxypeptidase-like regulatory domain-containing protein, partial [Acidobacteriota bacterium]|nr:carboxypeptidase-like regulatory domain-containing protein [Acidobacteriota bacterium]
MRHKLSLLIVSLFFLVITATAQDYRGRIEGIVTDQTKSVIADAAVTLLNVNTGIKTVRKTSDTGLYLFDLVDPGTYSVTIEATGFGVFVQENIVVQTRGDVTVNATLTPGAVRQNITVNETPA